MRFGVRSIFLQVSTQNKDPFALVCNGDFLRQVNVPCPDGFEILKVPVLGQNNVDFKTISDLANGEEEGQCLNGLNKGRDQLASI